MWTFRRMLRISSWTDHVGNEGVLNRLMKPLELEKAIKSRKRAYFGRIMRHDINKLLQNITEGKITSRKRARGRRIAS